MVTEKIMRAPLSGVQVDRAVQEVGNRLRDQLEGVTKDLRELLQSMEVELELPSSPASRTPASVADCCAEITAAEGQVDALRALLAGASALGSRALVVVVKGGAGEIWDGVGFEEDSELGSSMGGRVVVLDDPPMAAAVAGQATVCGEEGEFQTPRFGQEPPSRAVLVPITVQEKIVGVFYGDDLLAPESWDPEGLRALGVVTGLAVERLALAKALARAAGQAVETTGPVKGPVVHQPAPPPAPPETAAATPPPPSPEPVAEADAEASPAVEDARRFARLLMEEIGLYNADKVEAGRAAGDLLSRLGEEVEQARQMYNQRVSVDLPAREDHFEEALIRVLAGGKAELLGAEKAQPS